MSLDTRKFVGHCCTRCANVTGYTCSSCNEAVCQMHQREHKCTTYIKSREKMEEEFLEAVETCLDYKNQVDKLEDKCKQLAKKLEESNKKLIE